MRRRWNPTRSLIELATALCLATAASAAPSTFAFSGTVTSPPGPYEGMRVTGSYTFAGGTTRACFTDSLGDRVCYYRNAVTSFVVAVPAAGLSFSEAQLGSGLSYITVIDSVCRLPPSYDSYAVSISSAAGDAEITLQGACDELHSAALPLTTPVFTLTSGQVQLTISGVMLSATLGSPVLIDPFDYDADGFADAIDNCQFVANATQADTGGVGAGSAPDGIGDACQCGDVSGNGLVTTADAKLIALSLLVPPMAVLAMPQLCDVEGNPGCSTADAAIVSRAILVPATAALQQVCPPTNGPTGLVSQPPPVTISIPLYDTMCPDGPGSLTRSTWPALTVYNAKASLGPVQPGTCALIDGYTAQTHIQLRCEYTTPQLSAPAAYATAPGRSCPVLPSQDFR